MQDLNCTGGQLHKGDLYSFSMTCTAGGSSSQIDLIPFGQAPADGALYVDWGTGSDIIPSVTGIQVNCVAPTPTAMAAPTSARTGRMRRWAVSATT